MPMGRENLHRAAQNAAFDILVALEDDLAHFDLGTFLDHEGKIDGGGGNLP